MNHITNFPIPCPPLTQVQRIDLSMDEAKEEVCQLLGWSDKTYCEYQYRAGLDYIKIHYHGLVDLAWAAERSRVFWNWWKLHWLSHDQFYLSNISPSSTLHGRRIYYAAAHDVEVLAESIFPGQAVWDDLKSIMRLNLYDKNRRYAPQDQTPA